MGSSTASNTCGVAKLPARSARQADLATGRTGMASIGTTSSGRAASTSANSCRLASNSASSKVQSIRLAIPSSPANSLGSGPDPSLEASTDKRLKTCVVCRFTERHWKNILLGGDRPDRREAGLKVAWFSLEELGVLVRRHRADDSVTKAVRAILRARLIVVDDIGLLPVSPDAAEGFFRLVDAAYEKRSVAVSSNVHPAGFDELMPKTLATATVDRLLHHAHVCLTSGDSVRLAQATSGKGVMPLNMAREAGHAA